MTRARWTLKSLPHGVAEVRLKTWSYFADFLQSEMERRTSYVWRGHRSSNWRLQPTLERAIAAYEDESRQYLRETFLDDFKLACRGRTSSFDVGKMSEDEWWALGQHHGLATPLLDWTTSPYVAAFFAFAQASSEPGTKTRSIFALDEVGVTDLSAKLVASGRPDEAIRFLRPLNGENPRIVNQAGLFARPPAGMTIEDWLQEHVPRNTEFLYLLKIFVPDQNRDIVMRSLNQMNINFLSLFPDLYGASMHRNLDLEIADY